MSDGAAPLSDGVWEALSRRGISRRDFLRFCTVMTSALALPPRYAQRIVRALERLCARYALPPAVRLVDGGTLGLELLCYLEEAEWRLVLDAVLDDGPPGTLVRLAGEEVPAFFGMRTSPHEVGLADLLAVCRLRGSEPREVVVLGLRPETIELGWDLSDAVAARVDALAAAAADQLRRWGLAVREPAGVLEEVPHA